MSDPTPEQWLLYAERYPVAATRKPSVKLLTQTKTYPSGDCWQTSVACILDLAPEVMPSQAPYDWKTSAYYGPLNAYLRQHHSLVYVEIPLQSAAPVGWHIMTGRTVRSAAQEGARHVVVARHGAVMWDPHPSRAGLLEDFRWGLLVRIPVNGPRTNIDPCICPSCRRKQHAA